MRERTLGALIAGNTAIALLLGPAAVAAEQKVGLQEQTAVAVTIYNENLALVRDQRHTRFGRRHHGPHCGYHRAQEGRGVATGKRSRVP